MLNSSSERELMRPLQDVLRQTVFPELPRAASRLVVALPTKREFLQHYPQLPDGVQMRSSRIRSKRRGRRKNNSVEEAIWDSVGHVMARWREDGLIVKSEPTLVYIVEGEGVLHLGEYELICPKGTWVLVPPGVPLPDGSRPHLAADSPSAEWCDILWMAPWHNVLRCWVCHSSGDTHPPSVPGESAFFPDSHLRQCFNTLMHEAQWREERHPEICQALLFALFSVLQRLLKNQNYLIENSTVTDHDKHLPSQDAIEKSCQYIIGHIHEALTLESVARVVHLSRSRFAHEFHLKTGQTFNTYLTQCRLDRVEKMLVETHWQIAFIASSVGLSPSRLNTIFQEKHAMSPGEFRVRHHQSNRT